MKKILTSLILTAGIAFSVFAGDAAVFEEIGFSEDGSVFIFGQYGKTDVNFQAWADIFTVDVAKNAFVKDEVYTVSPSKQTAAISGKKAFEELKEKTEWKLAKYKAEPSTGANLLYVCQNENKAATEEIVFKDYDASTTEQSIYWHVKLVPYFEGSGKNCRSSFYLTLEKQDQNGTSLFSTTAGTPSYKRKGITSYRIDRIFTDKQGKSLVFVIEKKLEDDKGTSIRYMVETLKM